MIAIRLGAEGRTRGLATLPVLRVFRSAGPVRSGDPTEHRRYLGMFCRGRYPEIVSQVPLLRDNWFISHVETVTRSDVFELADIRPKEAFASLLPWVAAATATEINISKAANDLGIDRSAVVSSLEWLWTVFLIHELPPCSHNFTSRAVRRSKLHVTDTGLAANLLGIGPVCSARPQPSLLAPSWNIHGQRDLLLHTCTPHMTLTSAHCSELPGRRAASRMVLLTVPAVTLIPPT